MNISRWILIIIVMMSFSSHAEMRNAPTPWPSVKVSKTAHESVLYVPIMYDAVKSIPIKESDEELVDLLKINNPSIKPLASFSLKY